MGNTEFEDNEAQIEYLEKWKKKREEKKRRKFMKRMHLRGALACLEAAFDELKLFFKG